MNKDFRFLATGHRFASENMAIDEAVLDEVSVGNSLPTLRLYGWKPAAVSIGYFQSLEEEVDLAACSRFGVSYVRRMTGGGAVLHEDEITYSIHIPEKSALVPSGILESYAKISGGVIKGLARLGITAQFVPLNDLIIITQTGPKKISGNAQTRKKGVILQHGTILLKVDVDKMFTLLKVPNEKLKGKLIEDVKQRVTAVSAALGREVSFDESVAAIKAGFEEEFSGYAFKAGELGGAELKNARKLISEKYGAESWNKKR